MICRNCGSDTPDNSRFCSNCGWPVNRIENSINTEFDRRVFKNFAKKALSKRYWYAFLVCLINTIILGGLRLGYRREYLPNSRKITTFPPQTTNLPRGKAVSFSSYINPTVLVTVGFIFIFIFILALGFGVAYSFFLANPFAVGKKKFFIDNRIGKCELGNIFFAFKGGHYLDVVKSMAWRFLFLFLWTLLFVIPGIIKAYSYFLVPYIIADNPGIGYDRALKLSMKMTRGHKFQIFVLQLSFIGWYFLGLVCLAVGVLFVNPYYEASIAEMYVTLRQNAINLGICTPQELNLV